MSYSFSAVVMSSVNMPMLLELSLQMSYSFSAVVITLNVKIPAHFLAASNELQLLSCSNSSQYFRTIRHCNMLQMSYSFSAVVIGYGSSKAGTD